MDETRSFNESFRDVIKEKQVYANPWVKDDLTKNPEEGTFKRHSFEEGTPRGELRNKMVPVIKDFMKKAITSTTGGAGTAGTALIPVFVDPEIVDLTRKATPVVELISRRAVRGKTVDFNQLTALTAAQWLAEDAALSEQNDTYDRQSVAIKYLFSVGRVTGPAQAAMRGYLDGLNQELRAKTLALRYLEEETILRGNTTDNSTAYEKAESFVGFSNSFSTNSAAQSDYVTISAIRARNDAAFNNSGMIQWAVTDANTHTYIKGLLMDFQRFVGEQQNLPFGVAGSFSIDGVDFIKSRFQPTTSTSRTIQFVDPTAIEMGVLQDLTFQELAKTNDSDKFMLKSYETLVVKAEAFCAQLTSIT